MINFDQNVQYGYLYIFMYVWLYTYVYTYVCIYAYNIYILHVCMHISITVSSITMKKVVYTMIIYGYWTHRKVLKRCQVPVMGNFCHEFCLTVRRLPLQWAHWISTVCNTAANRFSVTRALPEKRPRGISLENGCLIWKQRWRGKWSLVPHRIKPKSLRSLWTWSSLFFLSAKHTQGLGQNLWKIFEIIQYEYEAELTTEKNAR